MPFEHYLTASINFELTHQMVLSCLFSDPDFLAVISGPAGAAPARVETESADRLFDLGVYSQDQQCLYLIEIKMWSSLSKDQLERQTLHLKEKGRKGLHILLGSTDLQYYREGSHDEINVLTQGLSSKIGYTELIELLRKFAENNDPEKVTVKMANDYRKALEQQYHYLQNAWLDPSARPQLHYYSAYSRIRRYLLNDPFSIYQVNNPSGAAYILNDRASWFGFAYKDHAFQLYQEILDGNFMIRIYSANAPGYLRNEAKQQFIRAFKETAQYEIGWSHDYRVSKWHKVAVHRPDLKTERDCETIADLFKQLNPVLKNIAASIAN